MITIDKKYLLVWKTETKKIVIDPENEQAKEKPYKLALPIDCDYYAGDTRESIDNKIKELQLIKQEL